MTKQSSTISWFLVSAAICLALDLGTKSYFTGKVAATEANSIDVIPGWFSLENQQNKGGMWSLFHQFGDRANQALAGVSAMVTIMIGIWALKMLPGEGRVFAIVLGAILGGALGNLYDRVFLDGVRDFVHFSIPNRYHHPTFNLADVFLICGAAILVIASLFGPKDTNSQQAAQDVPSPSLPTPPVS